MCSGVAPLTVIPLFSPAPAVIRESITSRCAFSTAMCKGVAPVSVVALSISTPALTSKWTTCRRPLRAAMCNGVAPSPVLALLLSAPFSISKPTTSAWPFPAAMNSGVTPWDSLFRASFKAPASSKSSVGSRCPAAAAWCLMQWHVAVHIEVGITRALKQLLKPCWIILQAAIIRRSSSKSGGQNSESTSFILTGCRAKTSSLNFLGPIFQKQLLPKSWHSDLTLQGLLHLFCTDAFIGFQNGKWLTWYCWVHRAHR